MNSAPTNGSQPQTREAVHEALWRLGDGAEVCATIEQIANACGLEEHKVRRSLASLVQSDQIVPAGKRGKTSVFRLSPQPQGPSRRRDATPPLESSSSSTNGRSAAHSDQAPAAKEDNKLGTRRNHHDSTCSAEDRKHLDEFEFTPEICRAGAALAQAHAESYNGHPLPPAVLQRRGEERPQWPKGRLDTSERYFEGGYKNEYGVCVPPLAVRAEIWVPPSVGTLQPSDPRPGCARFQQPKANGGVKA